MQKKYISCTFFVYQEHISARYFPSQGGEVRKGVPGGPSPPCFLAHVPACYGFCIIRPEFACCVRLGLSLLCVPLLFRPVFATLARCAHLIRLPLSYISAPPPALAHAWCMLVPAFCSSLPVSVWVHHSGSSGVERAEFTPYPSETIEKTYPIRMVKGVFLRIVSVCVCVTIVHPAVLSIDCPSLTGQTLPLGTVIHPHVSHVTTCNLKADIRGSDQSAVHVLPRTLSISSAWRGCGACPPLTYRKTRLILWQCVCARFGRIASSICWFFWSISTFFYRSTCLQVHDMWYHFLARYQQMWLVGKPGAHRW